MMIIDACRGFDREGLTGCITKLSCSLLEEIQRQSVSGINLIADLSTRGTASIRVAKPPTRPFVPPVQVKGVITVDGAKA